MRDDERMCINYVPASNALPVATCGGAGLVWLIAVPAGPGHRLRTEVNRGWF